MRKTNLKRGALKAALAGQLTAPEALQELSESSWKSKVEGWVMMEDGNWQNLVTGEILTNEELDRRPARFTLVAGTKELTGMRIGFLENNADNKPVQVYYLPDGTKVEF